MQIYDHPYHICMQCHPCCLQDSNACLKSWLFAALKEWQHRDKSNSFPNAVSQVPIPEIARLRTGQTWTVRDQEVPCEGSVLIPGPPKPALDISIILQRCGSACVQCSHLGFLCALFGPAVSYHVEFYHTEFVDLCCRGDAESVGLLFRSWNAGGEGSAAILFDFDRNILEAVFEVHTCVTAACHTC